MTGMEGKFRSETGQTRRNFEERMAQREREEHARRWKSFERRMQSVAEAMNDRQQWESIRWAYSRE